MKPYVRFLTCQGLLKVAMIVCMARLVTDV